jgi:23S rRNA (uridine2552-2'-O)-methyltransferase
MAKRGSGGRLGGRLGGRRGERVKIRDTGKRPSSKRWLERQLSDPYVAEAKARGLRSRAAFKLLQLDEKYRLLKRGQRVVDLGAAPGGWTQVAVGRVGPTGRVVGIDLLPMDPIPGATLLQLDFLDPSAPERLRAALGGPADVVLSDMAAPTTGHAQTDHLRIIALAEAAHAFATEVLAPGGAFVCKLFQGGATHALLQALKRDFATVRFVKPPASRADSAEIYLVAAGFRGAPAGAAS